MIVENINKKKDGLRILLVPLDWGLGHITRCIPIINILTKYGIEVYLAGEGASIKILEKMQPQLVILPLKGYRIQYSRRKRFFLLKLLLQSSKLNFIIKEEKRWLKKIIAEYSIDAVISDNRFGLHHPDIPSVFITHQLFIETGNIFLNNLAQKINYHFINKFDECWVPDIEGSNNLAGKLSHPRKMPGVPVKYLGIISRFKKTASEKKRGLLLLLSGPEPQRTIFENILLLQLKNVEGKITLIRGLPSGGQAITTEHPQLIVHDHLAAESLNELIQQSEYIIARSGYSTIMDLVTLQQKAILVPTPGQKEQEYLAAHLMKEKIFYTCSQEKFSIKDALSSASCFDFVSPTPIATMKEEIIKDWINKLPDKLIPLQ